MAAEKKGATRKASLDELHRLQLTGAELEVMSGPDAGVRMLIGPTGVLVGAGTDCDLQLDDSLASRRHLELVAEEDGVRVRDLGSTNGTLFSGAQLREVLFTSDGVVTVGDTSIAIRLTAEPIDVSVSPRTSFGDAVAYSPSMRYVFSLLEHAARSDVTVLLEGDSGTGKDVLATALHQESARSEKPFVVVDCGALPEGLVESELFGHEKGAFTGAVQSRAGAFEQADGGTIFLDEIGELPLEAQPKLLRALESRSFRRVGGAQTLSVNVRVVAATNRRLLEAVRHKEFREDLFYRLAVVHVRLPRLNDRPEDIVPLAKRFLQRATSDAQSEIPEDLARLLTSYPWPGNARELRNVVERFATFDRADARLLFGDAPHRTAAIGDDAFEGLDRLPYHDAKKRVMEAFHNSVLRKAVDRAGGSVGKAAELLGIPRASLYRMLQQLSDED
jgi:transcriptional regulator with PAS, ATPase and Fis domain